MYNTDTVTLSGQVHTDVDGYPLRCLRLACCRTAAIHRLRPGHRSDAGHVGTYCVRFHVLHVPHLLLPLHILRRESRRRCQCHCQ